MGVRPLAPRASGRAGSVRLSHVGSAHASPLQPTRLPTRPTGPRLRPRTGAPLFTDRAYLNQPSQPSVGPDAGLALGPGLPPAVTVIYVHIEISANSIAIPRCGHCQAQRKAAIVNTSLAADACYIPPGCMSRSGADR
jgi:hypothetical protein